MGSSTKSGSSGKSVEMSRADYEKRIAAELARIRARSASWSRRSNSTRTTAAGKTIVVPRPILVVGAGCEATRVVRRGPLRNDLPPGTIGNSDR